MKMDASLKLLHEHGYAVVSPNYSMLWQAPFPTQIYEMKAALRFLHTNGAKYDLRYESCCTRRRVFRGAIGRYNCRNATC
ncbi:hypothetical protein [Weissella ceti]|uniref:hypothetical protein n=1 Tax=Weissella ceti TaxID=759620 RepID=UPI0029CA5315|nr:hypothetical protein [Weissella ceti]